MAEYLNAKCSICGKMYHVCNDCNNTASFTPWRKIACSINCYKIFLALNSYTNKHSAKNETKEILSECDLSELNSFEPNIKMAIEEIMRDEIITKPKKKIQSRTEKGTLKSDTE
ncbi:MAG: hypothetical protein LUH21_03935 [Clostridiales bacterium]|nr:hypothetical protein [Clostridiales bacterium]